MIAYRYEVGATWWEAKTLDSFGMELKLIIDFETNTVNNINISDNILVVSCRPYN